MAPSASGASTSLTDLKGIVKESLRELLHEEPALFASRTDRRPPGSSGEDAPGGKYRSREVLCPGLGYLGARGRPRGGGATLGRRAFNLGARGRPRGGVLLAWRFVSCWRDERIYSPTGEGLGAMPDAGSVDRLGLGMTGGGGVEDGGEGVAAISGGGGGSDGAVEARRAPRRVPQANPSSSVRVFPPSPTSWCHGSCGESTWIWRSYSGITSRLNGVRPPS